MQAAKFIDEGDPVISVDAKKKESIGDFKNSGRTWRQIGDPEEVNVYDFPSLAIGSAIPYGIYDPDECKNLLICADGGGSNGSRNRSWKFFLQDLADEIGITITVCHFPPGTSKWNKIEHCMFSFISMNWREKPLASYETIIKLIGATKSKKISDENMAQLKIILHELYLTWNYSIGPRTNIVESRIIE